MTYTKKYYYNIIVYILRSASSSSSPSYELLYNDRRTFMRHDPTNAPRNVTASGNYSDRATGRTGLFRDGAPVNHRASVILSGRELHLTL